MLSRSRPHSPANSTLTLSRRSTPAITARELADGRGIRKRPKLFGKPVDNTVFALEQLHALLLDLLDPVIPGEPRRSLGARRA
jgi:hypothetical protein